LKLDELIRTLPEADVLLVHIEVADDSELIGLVQDQVAHHESLRDGEPPREGESLEVVEFLKDSNE
jgi:hypothetical protein